MVVELVVTHLDGVEEKESIAAGVKTAPGPIETELASEDRSRVGTRLAPIIGFDRHEIMISEDRFNRCADGLVHGHVDVPLGFGGGGGHLETVIYEIAAADDEFGMLGIDGFGRCRQRSWRLPVGMGVDIGEKDHPQAFGVRARSRPTGPGREAQESGCSGKPGGVKKLTSRTRTHFTPHSRLNPADP